MIKKGMKYTVYTCKKFNTSWRAPSQEEKKFWSALGSKAAGIFPELGIMKWLKETTDLTDYDIKSIAHHSVTKGRLCKFCKQDLPPKRLVYCSECNALNYVL
jgi:hypothetical protein